MLDGRPRGTSAAGHFHTLFERWARRVRARLALRHALTGAAIALSVALAPALAAWRTHHGALRPYAPLAALAGAAIGILAARRSRWSDSDVALFLDQRLATEETIATAIERRFDADQDPAGTVVVTSAARVLETADARKACPRLLRRLHALGPLAAIGLVAVAIAPLPATPRASEPPGVAKVQITEAVGLEKVAKLALLAARDDAQRERLEKIARDAEKLKEELRAGLEKRDAQDKIARLREAIAAERLSLGNGEQRAGLETATGRLQETAATRRASRALGDHDLERMDAEMEKVANARETQDRELAKKALEEAARQAKSAGAPDVARALDEERSLMEQRGARADTLRELAEAMERSGASGSMGDELRAESEALDRAGSDRAAKKLAESMRKALEKLSPEERKRLSDKLREMSKQGGAKGMKELADELSSEEGQKKLDQDSKDLANEDTEASESKRQRALDDAQGGAGDTQNQMGNQGQSGQGIPAPMPGGQGGALPGAGNQGAGGQQPGGADGAGGHGTHDTGTGSHAGKTEAVDAQTLKSRAKGPLNKGHAMPGTVTTFTPGKAGGTANARGTGDLRGVGPSEVDGVDRSDVPEEYRDHVRQYFQP